GHGADRHVTTPGTDDAGQREAVTGFDIDAADFLADQVLRLRHHHEELAHGERIAGSYRVTDERIAERRISLEAKVDYLLCARGLHRTCDVDVVVVDRHLEAWQ